MFGSIGAPSPGASAPAGDPCQPDPESGPLDFSHLVVLACPLTLKVSRNYTVRTAPVQALWLEDEAAVPGPWGTALLFTSSVSQFPLVASLSNHVHLRSGPFDKLRVSGSRDLRFALVDHRVRLKGAPREPEVVAVNDAGQLLPCKRTRNGVGPGCSTRFRSRCRRLRTHPR